MDFGGFREFSNINEFRLAVAVQRIQGLIEERCPVFYVDDMPKTIGAAFYHSRKGDRSKEKVTIPRQYDSLNRIVFLAHELGHIVNREREPKRWEEYVQALDSWGGIGSKPPEFWAARMVMIEEMTAEAVGRHYVQQICPIALPKFDSRARDNLNGYLRELGIIP